MDNQSIWSVLLIKIKDDDFKIHLKNISNYRYNKATLDTEFKRTFINESASGFMKKINDLIGKNRNDKYTDDTYESTRKRIEYLKDFIENNDGYRLFYSNGELICDEEKIQLIFRLTWFETNADVNRETNNGRGAVDYKISKGAFDVTLVEFKLAKNNKLKQNLKNQLKLYEKANRTKQSFKVIVYFTEEEYERLVRILKELGFIEEKDIYLIDARNDNKQSASLVK